LDSTVTVAVAVAVGLLGLASKRSDEAMEWSDGVE
jgi:hypothetical protein